MIHTAKEDPRLFIHGHSCCEIRSQNSALICDPWLLGSAYWRSWWNFPPQACIHSLIEEWLGLDSLFVYITHLHWDHFHGPTLKLIAQHCKNAHFLLPLTPEIRLSKDLRGIVRNRSIIELVHGRPYQLTSDLGVLSFQSGPFFADSALYINVSGIGILNANDSKLSRFALGDLLRKIDLPKFALRSHSSANYRACKRNLDGSSYDAQPDKSKEAYSSEFFEFCSAVGASFAIPFASNMAYLHRDTFAYNSGINSADLVVSYCDENTLKLPLIPLLVLPGESVNLKSSEVLQSEPSRLLMQKNRSQALREYALSKANCLNKQYLMEAKASLSLRIVENYFLKIVNACPIFLRWYLKDHISIHAKSENFSLFCLIDFTRKSVCFSEYIPARRANSVFFVLHPYVLNDVCLNRHFNSLGVSKRLEILAAPNNKRDAVFNYLCNTYEAEGVLRWSVIISRRFWGVWLKRWPELLDIIFFVARFGLNSSRHGQLTK